MKKLNVVVLAAGHQDFETRDGGYPLCLLEIDGTPLIERIVENANKLANVNFTFALRDEDIKRYHVDKVVALLAPKCRVVPVRSSTRGSACTALLAVSPLPPGEELLVISANELVDVDLGAAVEQFRQQRLDGGVLTFHSVHPRYSYVRLNQDGLVTEATQQIPISKHATTGIFWFARAGDFVQAAKEMIRKDAHVNGNYFVAKTYNEVILKQGRVGIFPLEHNKYHPLKTERQALQFDQGEAMQ